MRFRTTTVKGHGRGRGLGFPTINMAVPDTMPDAGARGVYAARARLGAKEYVGALYYGPVPAFGEDTTVLEIHLLDVSAIAVEEGEPIEIEMVKFIRGIMSFDLPELLVLQMDKDVAEVRKALTIGQ